MNFSELSLRSDYGKLVEVFTSYFYSMYLNGDELAFDIGANAGMHTANLSRILKNGQVFAFEPIPELCEKLCKLSSKNLEVFNSAVSPQKAPIEFQINKKNFGLSKVIPQNQYRMDDSEFKKSPHITKHLVNTVRLDELKFDKKLSFIKCDTEGYDFLALSTGVNVIRKYRPFIIFENGRNWNSLEYDYEKEAFFEFFNLIGYNIYDIHGTPLVNENWLAKGMSWEFISLPREISPLHTLQLINKFWLAASGLEEIKDWHLCPSIGKDASKWIR